MTTKFLFPSLFFLIVASSVFASDASPKTTIKVPFVYENPSLGLAMLKLDYGAPFNKGLPTVIVVADGQQFYVREGAMKALQENNFGNQVNVVGIISRGTTPAFIKAALDKEGKADWLKVWQIFNANEWIGDIETVRKSLVGPKGKIYLYGRSGGAYLVHQYLSKYGQYVSRAFTQSAVNPALNAELGIGLDLFWSDLGRQNPHLQDELRNALKLHPEERNGILITLQRQHFFIPTDSISEARATLIHQLASGDLEAYQQARKDYQVDDMTKIYQSNDIIPQDVRVLELISPSGAFDKKDDGKIYPLAETQGKAIKPLLDLRDAGKIHLLPFNFAALHRCQTQVFLLAGRYDEAVDYRTSIALASQYPFHILFIANDNHVFSTLFGSGMSKQLITSFFNSGLGSKKLKTTLIEAEKYRWVEQ